MSGKDPSVLLLEHHLKALKLPTVLRDYASLAAVCSQERSSFPQYLLRLVERELIDRERRATERRIKEAAFPVIKTIESFDFKVQPSINEPLVRELLRGEYIPKQALNTHDSALARSVHFLTQFLTHFYQRLGNMAAARCSPSTVTIVGY